MAEFEKYAVSLVRGDGEVLKERETGDRELARFIFALNADISPEEADVSGWSEGAEEWKQVARVEFRALRLDAAGKVRKKVTIKSTPYCWLGK